jgi:hypothetical protein
MDPLERGEQKNLFNEKQCRSMILLSSHINAHYIKIFVGLNNIACKSKNKACIPGLCILKKILTSIPWRVTQLATTYTSLVSEIRHLKEG